MDSFWRRARVLAAQRRESNVERLFVAGLLHDLGRLILYQQHGEAAATAFHRSTESGELFYDVERDIMGYGSRRGRPSPPPRVEAAGESPGTGRVSSPTREGETVSG